jgi:hypothetical protein
LLENLRSFKRITLASFIPASFRGEEGYSVDNFKHIGTGHQFSPGDLLAAQLS